MSSAAIPWPLADLRRLLLHGRGRSAVGFGHCPRHLRPPGIDPPEYWSRQQVLIPACSRSATLIWLPESPVRLPSASRPRAKCA